MAVNNIYNQGAVTMWEPSWSSSSNGVWMGAFFTIIGNYNGVLGALEGNTFGTILVSVYAIIAQIMLVNLLIAMMGDTFNNVNENADKEWKFSRYKFISAYKSSSVFPPPFSVFVFIIRRIKTLSRLIKRAIRRIFAKKKKFATR